MRHIRLTILLAAALAVALIVAGCGDSVPKDAVAKVGDTSITKAQFQHWLEAAARQQSQSEPGQPASQATVPDPPNFTRCVAEKQKQKVPKGAQPPPVAQLKSQCKQQYDGLKNQTMQFLISAQWLEQEAKSRGVKATPAQVRKTFEDQKKQAFPKEADYQKFLKTSGRTESDLLFQVRLSVLTNALQAKVVEKAGKVSDQQVKDYYDKNKKRFAQPESRDLRVVLTKNQKKAEQALAELKKKKNAWKSVVKKYSVDTASKAQGGKLPGVTKGTQEKAFDTAIFSAQKGQLKGPVKTQFGYYVFQVDKITPASQQTLQQASETIKNLLKSQGQQKALSDFVKDFQKSYRDKTMCADDYKTSQCKNGPKPQTSSQPAGGSQQPQGAPPTSGGAQGAPPTGAPPTQGGAPPTQGGAPPTQGGAPPTQGGAPPTQVPPGG
ncbi:MAG: peptidyl-prolyl cis-trans isomerase [Thermoleophilaceae bacterium]